VTTFEVREIDPHDEGALRAWWEVAAAAHAERPGDAWPAWEVARATYATASPERRRTLTVAVDGAETVAAGILMFPVRDNPHLAFAELWVHPSHRRRGVGRLLAADQEARTLADGRRVVLAEATARPGGPGAGVAFATALGYAVANLERIKVADLERTRSRWDALQAEAEAARGRYRIVTWDTDVPDEHVAGMARLLSGFYAQIPLGDMALEDSEWTVERLRASSERFHDVGKRMLVAGAVAPTGELVGISDARIDLASPETGFVGLTIVDAAHRGHRLGLAMKLAVARLVTAAFPACRRLQTSNAETNTPMSAVNERLGFVHAEDLYEMQKELDG